MRSRIKRWPLAILLPSIGTIGGYCQTASSSNAVSAATSSTASAATHTVNVGKADHKFEPDTIDAEVGDIVLFQFYPTNHSVIKAAYGYPCIPYEMIHTAETGLWSGFQPVGAILADPPTWNLTVESSEPTFFYCSAPESCEGRLMVGVINPVRASAEANREPWLIDQNTMQTLAHQKALAANSTISLSPGEPWPDEAEPLTTLPATDNMGPSATTPSRNTPSNAHESDEATAIAAHPHPFPPGAIAGVVVGITAIIGLVAALAFFIGRQKKGKRPLETAEHDDDAQGNPMPVATSPVQTIHGPGGIMYVPVQYVDYARMSMPPSYPQEVPIMPDSPGNQRFSAVSTHDLRASYPRGSLSPAVEMYVPKHDER